jgi:hypothetical protein
MMFKFLKIIGIGYLLSVSTLANATFIDNGDYTTDTESGLDWLDWTKTMYDTQAEALAEFSGDGWRIATSMEATDLLESYFGVSFPANTDFINGNQIADYAVLSSAFLSDFGITHHNGSNSGNYMTIVNAGYYGHHPVYGLYANFEPNYYGAVDFKNPGTGVALVKATPVTEPAIITIFALGFVGINLARRRRQS